MDTENTRVLVVDDAVVYRKIVSDVLSGVPGVEIVGTACDGKMAVACMNTLKPDLLVLDVDMPEMNGLEVLAYIKKNRLDIGAIMLSSVAQESRDYTIQALELGAFDFISKPATSSPEESKRVVRRSLCRVVAAFIRKHEVRSRSRGSKSRVHPDMPTVPVSNAAEQCMRPASQIVGIGVSTGGPNALREMLPRLPEDMGVPILIVQHMPPMFTRSLAQSLNAACKMEVLEAEDCQVICPNVIYIAPGGKQMKVVKRPKRSDPMIRITDDPPENGCRPAVDFLFRSIAQVYGAKATGVVMTGMGSDGKLGMKLIKRHGAATIAQGKNSCVVYGMPREVIDAGIVDVVAPLETMAQAICRTVQQGKAVLV
jgi:two-component system chemotaxis response regulator CheB